MKYEQIQYVYDHLVHLETKIIIGYFEMSQLGIKAPDNFGDNLKYSDFGSSKPNHTILGGNPNIFN